MIPLAIKLDSADLLDVRWRKGEHASAKILYVYLESGYFVCLPEAFVGPQPALQTFGCSAPGGFAPGRSLLRCYQPRQRTFAALTTEKGREYRYQAYAFLNCHAQFLSFCTGRDNCCGIICVEPPNITE
jgi:hypothetical protein